MDRIGDHSAGMGKDAGQQLKYCQDPIANDTDQGYLDRLFFKIGLFFQSNYLPLRRSLPAREPVQRPFLTATVPLTST